MKGLRKKLKKPYRTESKSIPTAASSHREAITQTVKRSARGNVQLAFGHFVTRQDKSLSKLDKI